MQVEFVNYIEIAKCFTLYLRHLISDTMYLLCSILYSLLKTYIYIITYLYTSIFSFFLLKYCLGPNVIETSVARTDLNNSLKVRVNKYCWTIMNLTLVMLTGGRREMFILNI